MNIHHAEGWGGDITPGGWEDITPTRFPDKDDITPTRDGGTKV